jgi:hypothetical protein
MFIVLSLNCPGSPVALRSIPWLSVKSAPFCPLWSSQKQEKQLRQAVTKSPSPNIRAAWSYQIGQTMRFV